MMLCFQHDPNCKRDYYIMAIQDNRSDYKKIFSIANKLLYRNESLPLPLTDNEKQLADDFNNFFVTKIDKIMSELVLTEAHPMDLKYTKSHETRKLYGDRQQVYKNSNCISSS